MGKETYKDTGVPITPHFSWAQALDAADAITVQSHTFDMHHNENFDKVKATPSTGQSLYRTFRAPKMSWKAAWIKR